MTQERHALTDLFTACWKDDALKARFMADPKVVLAERGLEVPAGMDVTVVENNDNTIHITMPMAPTGHSELSDEDLSHAAGGYSFDPACKHSVNCKPNEPVGDWNG